MRRNLKVGDCFSIKFNGEYFALICGSINKKTSPHFYNFIPTTFNGVEKATLQSLENESIYGKSVGVNGFEDNEKVIKSSQPEIQLIWDKYPENNKYMLGVFYIMISRKDFLMMESCFEYAGHLNLIENLLNTPSASFNGGSEETLKLFLSKVEETPVSSNQNKFSIKSLLRS